MTEPELETLITKEVFGADYEKEMEIWVYLEIFKRDNPHLAGISDLWNHVNGERPAFSESRWLKETQKSKIAKADKEVLNFRKNVVIDLILNTYGAHSVRGAAARLGDVEMLWQ